MGTPFTPVLKMGGKDGVEGRTSLFRCGNTNMQGKGKTVDI